MHTYGETDHWKLRFFSILFGQGFSLIGSSLTQFVLLWWIADTTGSVSDLSMAGLFGLMPQALFGAFGGAIADRHNRRVIMIVTDLVSAGAMVVLIILFQRESIELWHIYAMMFVRSSMHAFQQPAMLATTPLLVPQAFIPRAAGLGQMIAGAMMIASPPLGAIAIATLPIGYALGIDVATALLGILPLLIFSIPQLRVENHLHLLADIADGIRTVWSNNGLRVLYGLMAFIILIITPLFTLIPLLVNNHFHGGPSQIALMQSLGAIGMMVGGVIVASFVPRRKPLWIVNGFALASLSVALTGAPPTNGILLASIAWAFSSVFYVMGRASTTALLQTTVDNRMQGRVFSLLTTVEAMAAPVGLLLIAPIGDEVGVRVLFVVLGSVTAMVALLGHFSHSLKSLGEGARAPSPSYST